MTMETTLLIIGGGPGGYVAAIRAGQLGIKTVLVEGDQLGGTCLNVGCIPSKALIHAAEEFHKACHYAGDSPLGIRTSTPSIDVGRTVAWKEGIVKRLTSGVGALLKKNGVQVVRGWARILDGKTVEVRNTEGGIGTGAGAANDAGGGQTTRIRCEHLLLATGSEAVELPFLPFGGNVVSATEALSPQSLPGHLVVVGAGYIGLELGTAYRKLGARVTVVEAAGRVLPAYDDELVRPVAARLKSLGVELHLESSVLGMSEDGKSVRNSSVELDQVLEDQLTPAIPARLHQQSTFRKPAKLDRRETEIFRKRSNLRCGAVIVARQEHDSPATMHGRILGKDGSDQMVEALDQSAASEGLRDGLGRRLSSQFLRGHAVGIGHIDDGLSLPVGSAFATSWCDSKRTAKKMMSALTASASVLGMIWVRSRPRRMQSFPGRAWLQRILRCRCGQTPWPGPGRYCRSR
jgi:hypothetical protein